MALEQSAPTARMRARFGGDSIPAALDSMSGPYRIIMKASTITVSRRATATATLRTTLMAPVPTRLMACWILAWLRLT